MSNVPAVRVMFAPDVVMVNAFCKTHDPPTPLNVAAHGTSTPAVVIVLAVVELNVINVSPVHVVVAASVTLPLIVMVGLPLPENATFAPVTVKLRHARPSPEIVTVYGPA